jgi:SAM-dependent methyltransferase
MIAKAKELNEDHSRCNYFLNEREDLALFREQQFSFIYSIIVLQHLPTELARKYITEFVRILQPNGVLVFQLPARFVQEKELPANAFSAAISCPLERIVLTPGEVATFRVTVENTSLTQWNYNEPFSLHLGNHWLGPDGSMHVVDDGRTRLPMGVLPGQAISMVLQAKAPAVAGNYILELDVVQERVAWFKDRRSQTCQIEATVANAVESSTKTPALPIPAGEMVDDFSDEAAPIRAKEIHFDMHCTPRSDVVELLRSLGCKLEFIEVSGLGGAATLSYIYYARKSGK